VKEVEARVQSLEARTHCYTILPIISADGELKSPMLIVLQERNGRFPESGVFQV
jgi:hypothetical protein